MADDDDKTEEPTDRKLKKAREDGNVPKSEDFNGFMSLFVDLIMIFVVYLLYKDNFQITMAACFESIFTAKAYTYITEKCDAYISVSTEIALFIFAAGILGSFIGYFIMNKGFIISKEPIKLNIDALNIGNNLSNLINMQGVIGTAITIVKETLYYGVFFVIIVYFLPIMVYETLCYENCKGVSPLLVLIYLIGSYTLIAFIFAAIDVPLKIMFWKDKLKMSHKDIKDEHKEMEGAPEVKRAQHQFRHDILQGPPSGPKNATFFVSGGGMIIGIRYNKAESPAPIVVVIGKTTEKSSAVSQIAQQMRRLIIRDDDFVRKLMEIGTQGRPVPLEFVKDIRRYIMELRKHEEKFGPVHPSK